jgi:hypothetical protein
MVDISSPMLLDPLLLGSKNFGDLQLVLNVMEVVNHWSQFSVNF